MNVITNSHVLSLYTEKELLTSIIYVCTQSKSDIIKYIKTEEYGKYLLLREIKDCTYSVYKLYIYTLDKINKTEDYEKLITSKLSENEIDAIDEIDLKCLYDRLISLPIFKNGINTANCLLVFSFPIALYIFMEYGNKYSGPMRWCVSNMEKLFPCGCDYTMLNAAFGPNAYENIKSMCSNDNFLYSTIITLSYLIEHEDPESKINNQLYCFVQTPISEMINNLLRRNVKNMPSHISDSDILAIFIVIIAKYNVDLFNHIKIQNNNTSDWYKSLYHFIDDLYYLYR